jgi:threonine dehydrogenase-like Zn-dependent dehydrogenase
MRAITFQAVERLAFDTVGDPVLEAPTDVILEVEFAGLCGSDLHVYHGRETGLDVGTVMGHEYLGRIVEIGSAVETLAMGDRVVGPFTTSCGDCFYCQCGLTCRCERGELFGWREDGRGLHGAQAELLRVPLADTTLIPLEDSLPGEAALFVGDILATGYFGAELASVGPGDTVAVIGSGPVGLMACLAARERGAEIVYAFDIQPDRLKMAERFGALGIDPSRQDPVAVMREATDGRGADCVLEAVGSPEATRSAVDLVRPGGRISALGVHTEPTFAFSPGEAYDKNLTYRAGRCPARRLAEPMLEIVRRRADDLLAIVSHRLPLADGVEGYRMFAERRSGCTKVVFRPGL